MRQKCGNLENLKNHVDLGALGYLCLTLRFLLLSLAKKETEYYVWITEKIMINVSFKVNY